MILGVTCFTWMFWGYSLTFSRTGNAFIGDLASFGLKNVLVAPSPGSSLQPEIVFCFYQMLFCAITVMLVIGGSFERGRILPSLIFAFAWITIVYAPIANWTWNANGWLYNLPSLDFAGGGPVHQSSGWGALAYAFVLGKRRPHAGEKVVKKPHNTTLVFLGTVLIWFGWFGFNGGSALNASMRSMVAAFNTNTGKCHYTHMLSCTKTDKSAAAGFGAIGWVCVDMVRNKGKFSLVGACEGVIAGLVGITPAAGYVSLWLAGLIGFLTGVSCALCQNVNKWLNIDEGLEVFKLHGIGGMVGSFLTYVFTAIACAARHCANTQQRHLRPVVGQCSRRRNTRTRRHRRQRRASRQAASRNLRHRSLGFLRLLHPASTAQVHPWHGFARYGRC